MIISASRRTDIPTYYSDWFIKRIKEGFVLVRNPLNAHQISKISLSPDVVDGIVFWTKNPTPMLDKLDILSDYMFYFQFTLNAYDTDIEVNIPNKQRHIIPAFRHLSDSLGKNRVIWRYDPIFLNDKYTIEYHIRYFEELVKRLYRYTEKCTISFLDMYSKMKKTVMHCPMRMPSAEEQSAIAEKLAEIAHAYGLLIDTCAEGIDLERFGIQHAKCVDDQLFERLLGCPLNVKKDKSQRMECGCVESIDIGVYNTCRNLCRYCYANYSDKAVTNNCEKHDVNSPLLIGLIGENDKVSERKMTSCRVLQMEMDMMDSQPQNLRHTRDVFSMPHTPILRL